MNKPLSKIIFDNHDHDKDGYLSMKELRQVFYDLGHFYTTEQMIFALKKIDKDFDYKINYKEFLDWWRNNDERFDILQMTDDEQQYIRQCITYYRFFDKNNDGVLDKDNFHALVQDLEEHGYPHVDFLPEPLTFSDYMKWIEYIRLN